MADPSWTDNIANWTTAQDWSTETVPGATDNVTIAQGTPTIASNVGSIDSLYVTSTGSLTLDGDQPSYGYQDADLVVSGSLVADGPVSFAFGGLYVGGAASGSTLTSYTDGIIELAGPASNNVSLGQEGALILDDAAAFSGSASLTPSETTPVGPFLPTIYGSTVQLTGQNFSAYSYNGSEFVLSLDDGATEIIKATEASDAVNQGDNILIEPVDILNPPSLCFASGTLIHTDVGHFPVEDLRPGDIIVTMEGRPRPIVWIGHRSVECTPETYPVRILAAAFGYNMPRRDLYLSPGHPVLVGTNADGSGGHLVPIMCLINGTTIERVPAETITYWHVELDQHDILLAEGLPAESYIDLGSRPWFEGADGALYTPDLAQPSGPGRCRPVVVEGPIVDAERRRLDAMFAMKLEAACAWPSADIEMRYRQLEDLACLPTTRSWTHPSDPL